MFSINKSSKLDNVCYDIRGNTLKEAKRLEEEGNKILKLNIGNPAPFGFEAPDEILVDVIRNLSTAQGYSDSKGLYSARKAIMQHYQARNMLDITVEDIFIGNGVSELIVQSMQALLNTGDEMLVPAPDYPLWTAAVSLSSGKAVHYLCDEQQGWFPDLDDIRRKITPRTRGIVIINPNNPTGAVYSKELLLEIVEIARQHNLTIFADEIYDKILYDDAQHHSIAALAPDLFTVTFNGLSKTYRVAGFRQGWMVLNGPKKQAKGYIEGLEMLASMRLCANVPMQHAIQTALGGYQSISEFIFPGGRLYEQRNHAWELINQIPGVSCVKPMGALYMFPKIDTKRFNIHDDQKMVLDLLLQEKVLLVQGTAFNWPEPDHFRIVTLPHTTDLQIAIEKFARFIGNYRQ
ncbi:pyridoxal phosphate-dependent aminotransferase [Xenorhabdus bovienii]|uniref:Glutamate-pyruvate aminotransferase AlaA n=7 Tax=Xenorhabdus bovienii TaxID=40576 RepID=A0A077PDC9_XENBV|nr:pyridoxal phosphate-dependent aminotransferase [Xenorhabdus bovienii]MCG3461276.1 pyridoxal phosphate-dependent aminotransferase [Xenorhabdus bovienii]MCG3469943.1 pyridoxal phosphate-dependent aminotransferase [Xenorhabdus bovienii]MDE1473333.1 pyridoxal phosphate-dependent aminotransferase [Xenorhabdus bovienii]MDE1478096.1 pyridoxal phosphate-dependent aminotransferase [Xenorhabdus bovienii]MDE1481211.1 pyridoxal phosphate-dependent aminotransferase [Xenorhabdus bovienii]